MLQVIQYQKKGDITVSEMPAPECVKGGILVRTFFSLISAGTEKTTVSKAKSSIIQRAKKQPDDVKLVLDFIKKEGLLSTYKRIKSKLDSYKPLGYSAAGIVIESQSSKFRPGDRVACAGAGYANHAELITVPENLAVKIPDSVEFSSAAYVTLGAIAMQGVRQADLRLGETAAVIGLGLIGQITIQLLKASGCKVIAMDINENLFDSAAKSGADLVCLSNHNAVNEVKAFTSGQLCDAVLITAGTPSNQPLELALDICRKKGKTVIVGAVGMNVPRTPFYMKEIDLRISSSYGPGRYDVNYEEKGIDYPLPYVRWTENRNMQAFIDLIAASKINIGELTTHIFDVKNALNAYELIVGNIKSHYLGILLEYNQNKTISKGKVELRNINKNDKISIGFIGLGSFAANYLIPPINKYGVELCGVASQNPVNAKSAAENLKFAFYTSNADEIINDDRVNTIFIATRHDTHAKFVIKALKSRKPVFVEKPLAVTLDELNEIKEINFQQDTLLMTGFNRRFSKPFTTIKSFFKNNSDPLVINYRVNAGFIPKSHWVQFPENGGRIIGEVCHFIDCMIYLTDASPVSVYSRSISSNNIELTNEDNISIVISFSDGSIGTVSYIACGSPGLSKEYCEVHSQRKSAVMNNFETVDLYNSENKKTLNFDGKKGIDEEVESFLNAVKYGLKSPISFDVLYNITKTTIAALDSLKNGQAVDLIN